MSRESDNPSSNPPRPGADAYPSGTPPYGIPSDPSFSRAGQTGQPQQPGQPGQPPRPAQPPAEETRTETTLTTRIRINIPGSRPIPPVVVRSPMPGANGAETDQDGEAAGQSEASAPGATRHRHRSDTSSSPVLGVMESSSGTRPSLPDLPPEWRTDGAAPASAEPEAPSTWFAPRKKAPVAAPDPAPQPGAQPGTQAAPEPAPEPYRFGPTGTSPEPAPRRAFEPPAFEPPAFEPPAFDQRSFEQPTPRQPGYEQPTYEQPGYGQQPYGRPPFEQPGYERPARSPFAPPVAAAAPAAPQPVYQQQPYGRPEQPPAAAAPTAPPATAPRPKPAARPAANGSRPSGLSSGLDSTAAMPSVQASPSAAPSAAPPAPRPSAGDGFAGGTGGAGAPPRKPPADGTADGSAATSGAKGATKGTTKAKSGGRARKLAVTGIGVLVMISGVAYGAGLMLNQSDVPKGTTVLGQNIGGDTRDAAVHTLDGTVGKLAKLPLQLVVGGRTVPLDPSVAGLTIDTSATVQNVAQKSYNPVSVLESLRGGDHPAAPVVRIDTDKLRSALQQLVSGSAGGTREGSVHFTADGSVVTVMPQTGQSLDVDAAMTLVEQAYQNRAAGRPDQPVTIPVTTAAPKVSAAAVTAAADSIGKWAMKNTFTIRIHGVSYFYGKKTFSKSLTLQPDANGTMVPVFDLGALQSAYDFKNVKIKHNGTLGPVTPQDIATALVQLLSKPDGDHSITLS
ncbi:hypothetical protein [Streptacidiphilus sp. EB129]|uniref:hypothetical protein n=1 Tax=Streptacidiphilus sp. EB129 TaxID=3156262 RepID=UPI0035174B3E